VTRIKRFIKKKVLLTTSHNLVKWFIIFAYHRDGAPLSDPHVRNWCKNNIQGHSDRACSQRLPDVPDKARFINVVYIELIVSTIRGTSKYRNANSWPTFLGQTQLRTSHAPSVAHKTLSIVIYKIYIF